MVLTGARHLSYAFHHYSLMLYQRQYILDKEKASRYPKARECEGTDRAGVTDIEFDCLLMYTNVYERDLVIYNLQWWEE